MTEPKTKGPFLTPLRREMIAFLFLTGYALYSYMQYQPQCAGVWNTPVDMPVMFTPPPDRRGDLVGVLVPDHHLGSGTQ